MEGCEFLFSTSSPSAYKNQIQNIQWYFLGASQLCPLNLTSRGLVLVEKTSSLPVRPCTMPSCKLLRLHTSLNDLFQKAKKEHKPQKSCKLQVWEVEWIKRLNGLGFTSYNITSRALAALCLEKRAKSRAYIPKSRLQNKVRFQKGRYYSLGNLWDAEACPDIEACCCCPQTKSESSCQSCPQTDYWKWEGPAQEKGQTIEPPWKARWGFPFLVQFQRSSNFEWCVLQTLRGVCYQHTCDIECPLDECGRMENEGLQIASCQLYDHPL